MLKAAAALAAAIIGSSAAADTYRCTIGGKLVFSDRPCAATRTEPAAEREMSAAEIQQQFEQELAASRQKKEQEKKKAEAAARQAEAARMACTLRNQTPPDFYIDQKTGAVPQLEALVRSKMRDPDSFKVVSWSTAQNCGTYTIFITYRARNGFGGMNVESAKYIVDKAGRVVESTHFNAR